MIYSSLDSSHLDESNDYLIINIEAILAEIFRFEDFNAIERTYHMTVKFDQYIKIF
jgi:hypothetical protein